MKIFNKASKFLSDYFKHDSSIETNPTNIEDNLIYLNSQIVIWKEDENYEDNDFNDLLSHRFNDQFMIYNLMKRKIEIEKNSDKVVDFDVPDLPSYTLEFLLSFSISAKNWLSLDSYNVLIVHDDLKNPRVISLLSTVMSYLNKNTIQPMDLYANIISTNKAFEDLANISLYKNVTRYINYYSMLQRDPIFDYKKLFLSCVMINGAPAIQNEGNTNSHYITINDKSYYRPVIRIVSSNKVVYCSYKKYLFINFRNSEIEPCFYSPHNSTSFKTNCPLFGETVLEVLHYSSKENKFKQLFLIQFHSFYVGESGIRFTKDQIDGICKDIRYPDEFFIDLLFDDNKSVKVSAYEEEVAKWKNIISDFILKGFKNNSVNSPGVANLENKITEDKVTDKQLQELNIDNVQEIDTLNKLNLNSNHEVEGDDLLSKPNTVNKAEEILLKFGGKEKPKEDEDEDDEDIENYLKNLENKTN